VRSKGVKSSGREVVKSSSGGGVGRIGGGEAAAEGVFGEDAGVGELEEVVGAASLGAHAGEAEAAEGLAADEGAGDATVEVEVADAELCAGAGEVGGAAGEEAAGELVGGIVGELEGVVEVFGAEDGEDGAEDFIACDAVGGEDVGEHVRRDTLPIADWRLPIVTAS